MCLSCAGTLWRLLVSAGSSSVQRQPKSATNCLLRWASWMLQSPAPLQQHSGTSSISWIYQCHLYAVHKATLWECYFWGNLCLQHCLKWQIFDQVVFNSSHDNDNENDNNVFFPIMRSVPSIDSNESEETRGITILSFCTEDATMKQDIKQSLPYGTAPGIES